MPSEIVSRSVNYDACTTESRVVQFEEKCLCEVLNRRVKDVLASCEVMSIPNVARHIEGVNLLSGTSNREPP